MVKKRVILKCKINYLFLFKTKCLNTVKQKNKSYVSNKPQSFKDNNKKNYCPNFGLNQNLGLKNCR